MKKVIFTIALIISLMLSIKTTAQSQSQSRYGIHYSGGYSDASLISSNIGENCEARGSRSFAGGLRSIATGSCGFAFGNQCEANQTNSYVLGNNAKAFGANNLALGFYIENRQNGAIIIGSGENVNSPLITTVPGITMGMGSSQPTLFISKALGYGTGKVGIGNVFAPEAKLHIRSDQYEDAGVFLDPFENQKSYIRLSDANHELSVNENGIMKLLALNNIFQLESKNASIINGEFTLGAPNDSKLKLMTTNFPAFYVNASRSGNAYACYEQGTSFAIEFNNDAMLFRTAFTAGNSRLDEITNWRDPLCLKTNGSIVMNGKVGINGENTTSDYTLAVVGGIITTKVFIQDVEEWPDYVFEDTYNLMPLHELKKFVGDHKHLPNMPSEDEIIGQGYDMQEMHQALMRKIEELTLYTLQQQEEIDALKRTIDELKGK